jgi:NAD(P)-dependent dehydrogenase (short-subunit alcohol dehydrogenase family)
VNRLEGKHVVVTGAAKGIGLAIAERLGAEGAHLTLLDRDQPRLDGATIRVVDISDRDAVFAAFTEPLDALVANAGIGGANEPGEGDRFDEIMRTNLYGTYWCARAAEPLLADGGRIVVISSILSRIGVAGYTAYCSGSCERSPPSSPHAGSR